MDNKNELHPWLRFNPNIIADPVPWWLFEHIDKSQLNKIAKIQLDYHIAIGEAHLKALRQVTDVLGK